MSLSGDICPGLPERVIFIKEEAGLLGGVDAVEIVGAPPEPGRKNRGDTPRPVAGSLGEADEVVQRDDDDDR
jgi:hypothetical protein